MSIAKRGRLYRLRRRVLRRYSYRLVEPRETIWISLHIDLKTIAHSKADRAWSYMIEACEARLAGNNAYSEARHEAARGLLRTRGFVIYANEKLATFIAAGRQRSRRLSATQLDTPPSPH